GPRVVARIVGYRPEHSLVIRVVDPCGRSVSYAKIYRNGGHEAARRHDLLTRQVPAADPHLRIPAAVARTVDGRIVVFEAIDGHPLGGLGGGGGPAGGAPPPGAPA